MKSKLFSNFQTNRLLISIKVLKKLVFDQTRYLKLQARTFLTPFRYEDTIEDLEKENCELRQLLEDNKEQIKTDEEIEKLVENKVKELSLQYEKMEEDYNDKIDKMNFLLENNTKLEDYLEFKVKELKELK